MSLVPIIYTSLALFFGLLIIVVMISFLSYKARGKKNPLIVEEINKHKKLNASPKIIVRQNNNVELKPIKKIDPHTQKIPNVQSAPLVLPSNYFRQDQNVRQNQHRETKIIHEVNDERRKNTTLYNMGMKTRIEIMNNNKKFKRFDENNYKKNSMTRSINDLTQFNIFSFYSDNNLDQEFVTATAVPHQQI